MVSIKINQPNVVEPVAIVPVFCSGLTECRVAGGLLHLALYVEQLNGEGRDRPLDRAITLRLIMPLDALREARSMVSAEIERASPGFEWEVQLRESRI